MRSHQPNSNQPLVNVSDLAKYSELARKSGIAGLVICISWSIAILTHFASVSNPVSVYSMRFAHCLLVLLPIPAIVTGVWSVYRLNKKDHGKDIGYAVFGIFTGILSIAAIVILIR